MDGIRTVRRNVQAVVAAGLFFKNVRNRKSLYRSVTLAVVETSGRVSCGELRNSGVMYNTDTKASETALELFSRDGSVCRKKEPHWRRLVN